MYFYIAVVLVIVYFIGIFLSRTALSEALVVLIHNPYFTVGSNELTNLIGAMEAGRIVTRTEALWQLIGVLTWPIVLVWLLCYFSWRNIAR